LTCYAVFAKKITQFTLTGNFTWTSCGGTNFCRIGTVLADVEVASDAAGSIGYGAYLKDLWFAGSWAPSQQQQSIAYKELFPVVIAAHVWGHMWCKKHALFRSDNNAVVHVLNFRTSKVPCLMLLLCRLLLAATRQFFLFCTTCTWG